jgi:hypothetical protein
MVSDVGGRNCDGAENKVCQGIQQSSHTNAGMAFFAGESKQKPLLN